jgi:hypothetical protein
MKDVNTFMFGQRQKETFISNFTNLRPAQFGEMDTMIKNARTAYKSIVQVCDKCDDMMIAATDFGKAKVDLVQQRKIILGNIQTLKEIKADIEEKDTTTKKAIKHLDRQIAGATKLLDQFDKRFGAFVKKNKAERA